MIASRAVQARFFVGCGLAWSFLAAPALAQVATSPGLRVDVSRELRRAEAALETPVSFDYVDAPLQEVIDDLERQIRLPIQVRIEPEYINPDEFAAERVTAAAQDVPCSDAAPLLLGGLDLTLDVRPHGVVLVSNDDVQNYLRSYHVREIISAWAAAEKPQAYRGLRVPGFSDPVRRPDDTTPFGAILPPQQSEDGLIVLVTRTIEPDTWDSNGGEGALSYAPAGGLLVVDQTYAVHREIEHLLNVLLAAVRSPDAADARGRR